MGWINTLIWSFKKWFILHNYNQKSSDVSDKPIVLCVRQSVIRSCTCWMSSCRTSLDARHARSSLWAVVFCISPSALVHPSWSPPSGYGHLTQTVIRLVLSGSSGHMALIRGTHGRWRVRFFLCPGGPHCSVVVSQPGESGCVNGRKKRRCGLVCLLWSWVFVSWMESVAAEQDEGFYIFRFGFTAGSLICCNKSCCLLWQLMRVNQR